MALRGVGFWEWPFLCAGGCMGRGIAFLSLFVGHVGDVGVWDGSDLWTL